MAVQTVPGLPVFYPFKTRCSRASSSSSLIANQTTIAARCKYMSTLVSLTGVTTAGGTSGIDIWAWQGALTSTATVLTTAPTLTTIASGTAINTSTGNITYEFLPSSTIFFNKGDILCVQPSTGASAIGVTHVVQEF